MEYFVDDKIVIRLLSSLTLYFTPSPPSIQLPKQSPNSNFILINWTCNTFQLVPTENLNHSKLHVQPQVKVFKEKPALLCLKIRLILFDLKKIINQYCYKLVTKYTITTSVLWFRTHVCALVDHRKYSHFIHVSRHTMFIIFIFYIIICFHVLQYI